MNFNSHEFLKNGVIISLNSNEVIVGWGDKEWTDSLCSSEASFFFPDYFLNSTQSFFKVKSTATLSLDQLIEQLEKIEAEELPCKEWKESDKVIFEKGFNDVQGLISKGEIQKAVMYSASKSNGGLCGQRLLKALKSLIRYAKNYPVYFHGFWDSEQGVLGGTPEILFKVNYQDAFLETMALAGTVSNEIPPEIVMNDRKLIHEHRVVLDSLHSSLKTYGDVRTGKLELLKFRELSNLYVPIRVSLKHQPPFINLVKDLHPTPALGAFPKEKGWKWLEDFNKLLPRGRFGGPAGFYAPKENIGLCYVAIRNVAWNTFESAIFAGCGIVQQSKLEDEWQEVTLKIQSVRKTMDL